MTGHDLRREAKEQLDELAETGESKIRGALQERVIEKLNLVTLAYAYSSVMPTLHRLLSLEPQKRGNAHSALADFSLELRVRCLKLDLDPGAAQPFGDVLRAASSAALAESTRAPASRLPVLGLNNGCVAVHFRIVEAHDRAEPSADSLWSLLLEQRKDQNSPLCTSWLGRIGILDLGDANSIARHRRSHRSAEPTVSVLADLRAALGRMLP
jgi:hypothetical protein